MLTDKNGNIVIPSCYIEKNTICTQELCYYYKTNIFYEKCFPHLKKPKDNDLSKELGKSGIYFNKPSNN